MQHLDISPANALEMRVSKPHLVEELARAALKDVPGSNKILDEHFKRGRVHQLRKAPRVIKPQQIYDCYGTQ